MRIQKIACTVTLLMIGLVWSLVSFPETAIQWSRILEQARLALLAWRLMLYAGLAVSWYLLTPHLKQHAPSQYLSLCKTARWSVVLLIVCEISNLLQAEVKV
ncbi:hypothetical protein BH012_09845 [Salmonella enterica]|nr:hypothetical protein [Salmonella enterica]EAX6601623.1 hypothetical protein [Salmonella enterica]